MIFLLAKLISTFFQLFFQLFLGLSFIFDQSTGNLTIFTRLDEKVGQKVGKKLKKVETRLVLRKTSDFLSFE